MPFPLHIIYTKGTSMLLQPQIPQSYSFTVLDSFPFFQYSKIEPLEAFQRQRCRNCSPCMSSPSLIRA